MKPDNNLYNDQGINLPITENGITTIYTTNAPDKTISSAFKNSSNTSEFIRLIQFEGYKVNRFNSVYNLTEKEAMNGFQL